MTADFDREFTTQRGQMIVEGEDTETGIEDLDQPRFYSKSVMQNYDHDSKLALGSFQRSQRFKNDSKFRNQGFLNIQNQNTSRGDDKQSRRNVIGSIDQDGFQKSKYTT